MITQKEVEENTLERFSFLKYSGLEKFTLKHNSKTVISFLGENIGVQVELDWRDVGVFVLLVKLDNGSLPDGYYVYNGKIVRVHLLKFIEKLRKHEIKIEIPNIYPKKIPYNDKEECLKIMDSESEKYAKLFEKTIKLLPNNQLECSLIFE